MGFSAPHSPFTAVLELTGFLNDVVTAFEVYLWSKVSRYSIRSRACAAILPETRQLYDDHTLEKISGKHECPTDSTFKARDLELAN